MQESRRSRRYTLDRAYIDWQRFHQGEARATFLYSGGLPLPQQMDQQLSLSDDVTENGEQRGGEDGIEAVESLATSQESLTIRNEDNPAVDSDGKDAEATDENPRSALAANVAFNARGFEPFNMTKLSQRNFEGDEAPGFVDHDTPAEFQPPPPPKRHWAPPLRHQYCETSTQYVGEGWRYDIITSVEDYRISTIPDDFIGCSSGEDRWTPDLKLAYEKYKAFEYISNTIGRISLEAVGMEALKDHKTRLYFLKVRWDAALSAGTHRTNMLRKWPSAFEGHSGTSSHWHEAKAAFAMAEAIRLQAKQLVEETVPKPDPYNVPCNSEFKGDLIARLSRELVIKEDGRLTPAYIDIAIRILPDLLRLSEQTTESTQYWIDMPIHPGDRRGKPVYALNPIQYESMRSTNQGFKDGYRRDFNDQSKPDITAEAYPEACYPDLPPVKNQLANTYDQGIDNAARNMKCRLSTYQGLAGFWAEETERV